MTDDSLPAAQTLAELVATRLCHDLINPVWGVENGIEFLRPTLSASPELDLLEQSAKSASARIKLYRIAFGSASASETVEARALAGIVAGIWGTGRTEVIWAPQPLHKTEARLMLLAILCADSALPQGGLLRVDTRPTAVRIEAEARRTRFETEPWAHLVDGIRMAACDAAQVHFLLARRYLDLAGRKAMLESGGDGFRLVFGA